MAHASRTGAHRGRTRLPRLPHRDVARRAGEFVVADCVVVRVPEGPVVAVTPATDRAGLEQGAGVIAAGRYLHDRPAHRDVTGGRWCLVVADDVIITIPQRTEVRGAPAADDVALENRAIVLKPGRQLAG